MTDYDETDEFCPQYFNINIYCSCDNQYVIPAVTKEIQEI